MMQGSSSHVADFSQTTTQVNGYIRLAQHNLFAAKCSFWPL